MMRDRMDMYSVPILRTLLKTRREANLDQSERAFLGHGISIMDLMKYGSDVERYQDDTTLKASIRKSVFELDDAMSVVARAYPAVERMATSIDFEKLIDRCTHTFRSIMQGTRPNRPDLDLCIEFFTVLAPAVSEEEVVS